MGKSKKEEITFERAVDISLLAEKIFLRSSGSESAAEQAFEAARTFFKVADEQPESAIVEAGDPDDDDFDDDPDDDDDDDE